MPSKSILTLIILATTAITTTAAQQFPPGILDRLPPTTPSLTTAPTDTSCTSTMHVTASRLPTPPYWPQCSWDGTVTFYPSTQTVTSAVDCRGCGHLSVVHEPSVVHCPAEIINGTMTAVTPSTMYETACSQTTTTCLETGR